MSALPKLYELSAAYAELIARDDLDEQALCDTLDSLDGAIEVKAQNSIAVLMEMEDYIDACKKREAQFAQRRKTAENRLKWLKDYWRDNMVAMGKDKIQTDLGPIALRNNPKSVEITDQSQIPSDFIKVKMEQTIDKIAIKQAIEAGQDVPGAVLVQGRSVRVG